MVEEMYKETTAVVRAERETSEQFGVGVGLRQGSALSPLLFIMVMNLISGKVSEQEELKKILQQYSSTCLQRTLLYPSKCPYMAGVPSSEGQACWSGGPK